MNNKNLVLDLKDVLADIKDDVTKLNDKIVAIDLQISKLLKNDPSTIGDTVKNLLTIKSSNQGLTLRDMNNISRTLQKFIKEEILDALDNLVAQGDIELRLLDTPSGRGRKREAYFLVDKK